MVNRQSKRRISLLPALFVLSLQFSGLRYGQASEEQPEQSQTDPIVQISDLVVVTATRYEEKVVSVPAHVTVITQDEIARSTAQDIPGLLRNQVGIHVSDITGNRRTYRVDLRGFGETAHANTLVLVDGRRVNQPDLSGTDWMQLPLYQVERIEVVRGGRGSVLYGDNASAGVINIITKQGDRPTHGAELRGGSYGTIRAHGYTRGSSSKLSYTVSGGYFNSDGYRENSSTEGGDLGVHLGFAVSDSFSVALSGGFHSDSTGLPGALRESEFAAGASRTDTTHPDDFADIEDYYLMAQPQISFQDLGLLQLDLSFRRRESLFFSSFFGGSFQGDTGISTIMASPKFVVKKALHGLDNNFAVGLDFTNSEEDILNTSFFGAPSTTNFTLEKRNYGFYVHDEIYPIENLALSAGYRYDSVRYRFQPSIPSETHFDRNLFTAGANYNLQKDSYLYFSYARSFRYPVLDELFNFFANTVDPTLTPQTSDDFELGMRHFFTPNFYGNLNYFYMGIDDEIFFNPSGGPFGFGANENLDGRSRRTGVEVQLGSTIRNVAVSGSYTFANAKVLDGALLGNRVPSVPRHLATVSSTIYLSPSFTLGVNGSYVGPRFFESDYPNIFGEQEDYFLLNAKLTYDWGRRFQVFVDVNNLLNQEYAEYGVATTFPSERGLYPSAKANVLLGLAVRF